MATPEQETEPAVGQRTSFWPGWFGGVRKRPPEGAEEFLAISAKDEREEISISEGSKRYSRAPSEYDHPMWSLGWTDGRAGLVPEVNERLIEAQAAIELAGKLESAERRVADAETALDDLTQERDRLIQQQTALGTRLDQVEAERREHYGDFSRKQGWAYFIFGSFVLAADIPLSLRLVAAGFGVRITTEVPGRGVIEAQDILSSDFFLIVQKFWEAILLALGIAFTSILVKYFFDTVVFRGHAFDATSPPAQRAEPSRLVIYASVLAMMLFAATTVFLGLFRAEIQPQVDKYEAARRVAAVRQQAIDEEYEKLLPVYEDAPNPMQSARDAATSIVDARPQPPPPPNFTSRWGLYTFILLTLLFPVVSGISFSVGGKKFRNAFLYRSLAEKKEELEGRVVGLAPLISERHGEAAAARVRLASTQDPKTQEHLLQRLRYLYLHGYERGTKNVPHTSEIQEGSVYQLSYKYFQKLLSEGLRNK
jgi:hypothetical protein